MVGSLSNKKMKTGYRLKSETPEEMQCFENEKMKYANRNQKILEYVEEIALDNNNRFEERGEMKKMKKKNEII